MGKRWLCLAAAVLFGFGCGSEKLPSRDEIPILRQRVYLLEEAVSQKSREGIDSLSSVELLDEGLSSDSLLATVYGAERDFPFLRFGDYSIFYNDDIAVVTCKIVDSSEAIQRPFKLTYKKFDKVWLLKSFGPDAGAGS